MKDLLINGFKSNARPMKDAGIYWKNWNDHTYLNNSETLAIYTTKDKKTIKVYDLVENKLVQESQLKDPESKNPNEALKVCQRVS